MPTCAKLIPKDLVKCIDSDEVSLSEILELFRDELQEDTAFIVIINGKPIDNYNHRVSSSDEIIIALEFMGG